jgi:hypothetical protein
MVILHTKIFKKVWLSSLGRFNQIWLFFYNFFSLLIIEKSREPLLVKNSPNKNKADKKKHDIQEDALLSTPYMSRS